MDSRRGNGRLAVESGEQPLLLNIQPDTDGTQTGSFDIAFSIPLLIRDITVDQMEPSITWQGPTEASYTIESSKSLGIDTDFTPIRQDIIMPDVLHRETLPPVYEDRAEYFRINEE